MRQPTLSHTPSCVYHANDVLGEGPLWDATRNRLLWIDIERGIVQSWSEAHGYRRLLELNCLIGSIALTRDGLLLATSNGLVRWCETSGELDLLADPTAGKPVRFNDGKVDSAGRFWVGTMALDPARYSEPLGALWRLDPDGGLHLMEEGLTISNGLDWSPEGTTFYLADTMRGEIRAYDFDLATGGISNKRIHVRTAADEGLPDGLAVDASGDLWSAAFGGSVLHHYDPSGMLIETVALPVSCPTAIAFGGSDLRGAYITTSRHVLAPGHGEAAAGALLRLDLPVAGQLPNIFAAGADR